MNKLGIYGIGIVGVAALGLVAAPSLVGALSPSGAMRGNGSGYGQMIQTKAEMFGMTQDELTEQLKTKTMLQIAEEKGISKEAFQESMEKAARARWAEKGLTQEQIDERVKRMEERQAGDHESNSMNRGGMRQGRHNQ